ncbi:MAG: lipopolysaccharide biosynthesis protein [Anaerococcus sp.]|nr:lipopolysaccharide biosynthesis protein [Anaerococcus sp.]
MRKITSDQLLKTAKNNLLLILLPGLVLFGLIFYLTAAKGSKSYEAEAMLMVKGLDDEEGLSYNNILLNEKLSNIYGQFLESADLYDKVSDKLGADFEGEDIKGRLAYEVDPASGLITFTYKDKNEARAADTLTLITEEYRSEIKDFLNMDNIDYLQKVKVSESSNVKGIIFSVLGFFMGAFFGIFLIILKAILSDKIGGPEDIENLGLRLLASNKDDFLRVKVAINNLTDNSVIGIAGLGRDETFDFTEGLALEMANSLGVLLVDGKRKVDIDDKYLSTKDEIKVLRKGSFDLIKPDSPEEEILDSYEFEDKLIDVKNSYNYVFIDEGGLDSNIATVGLKYEDYKILLVDKKIKKEELVGKVRDIENLGVKVLGVVYYK